jgi:hypothetical protein
MIIHTVGMESLWRGISIVDLRPLKFLTGSCLDLVECGKIPAAKYY